MAVWQYHAMRLPSRAWLDRDLPLSEVQLGPALSGPFAMKATIDPEFHALIAEDGTLLLAEWATLIVAEADDQIQGAAILTRTTITGSALELDCVGISAFADGQEFEGTKTWGGKTNGQTGHGVDPLDVIRHMWAWLQDQPDADLGVILDDTQTPYVLGAWHNARKQAAEGQDPPKDTEVADPITFDGIWDKGSRKPAPARGKAVYWQHTVGWWDNADIAATVDEYAKKVPFDYRETGRWADAEKTDVVLGIEFGHPRLGTRLTEQTFIEGENITEVVPIDRGHGDYANSVTVHGAGEGSEQLRATATRRDGRLRRAHVVDATDTTSTATLEAIAADTLNRSRHLADITTLTVAEHPSAPLGTYTVGDDILVQTGPSWQPQNLWVRITALDIDPEAGTTDVTCSRSDAWDYSGRAAQ